MQAYVLYCTKIYICAPAVKHIRELYQTYHDEVFSDEAFSPYEWEHFPRKEELCQVPLSQPRFFLAILVIWTATCWVDLSESLQYLQVWCRAQPPTNSHLTELQHNERDDTFLIRGVSTKTKSLVIGFILVPKVSIALYLWWLGARWLMSTTCFQDVLLNAVALAFITELDELIYKVVVPEDIQALVQQYKMVRPCEPHRNQFIYEEVEPEDEQVQAMLQERDKKYGKRIASMLLTMVVIAIMPVIYMMYFQRVLPDYRWDVHAPCEEMLRAMLVADD